MQIAIHSIRPVPSARGRRVISHPCETSATVAQYER